MTSQNCQDLAFPSPWQCSPISDPATHFVQARWLPLGMVG